MNEAKRKRRLFFALWPSDELRREIEHETRHVVRDSGGRIIPAENLHITLVFLGSTPESRMPDAIECRRSVHVEPFELRLREIFWWKRQELLCLRPEEQDQRKNALTDLVERLRTALAAKNFAVERRPFRPHITLARDVKSEHESKLVRELHWVVDRFELIESRTLPSGSVYSVLRTDEKNLA